MMLFVKTFKGYEDRTAELDRAVNDWIIAHREHVNEIVDIKAVLSHENNSRANSGDLLYTVLYKASAPAP